MHLTPCRNAVLGYAEWCCDRRLPWPKLRTVAADLARSLREVERAFAYLEAQGIVSVRYCGNGYRKALTLWDGRETAHSPTYKAVALDAAAYDTIGQRPHGVPAHENEVSIHMQRREG